MTNAQYSYFPLTDLHWLYCWNIPVPACRKSHLTSKSHSFNLNNDFHFKIIKKIWIWGDFKRYMAKDEYFCFFLFLSSTWVGTMDVSFTLLMLYLIHRWCISSMWQLFQWTETWEIRINNYPTTDYRQISIYFKSTVSKSTFPQHLVLPSITLWVWCSASTF